MAGMLPPQCPVLPVPRAVMQQVVHVESSFNRYAIGVVGGRLARQPMNLSEALSTVRMLEQRGYNFSLGLAQVNRYNLARLGLASYAQAFEPCPNLRAGARILAQCHERARGDWGKALSCYYSGNFETGFRDGYVHKVLAPLMVGAQATDPESPAIELAGPANWRTRLVAPPTSDRVVTRAQAQPDPPAAVAVEAAATPIGPVLLQPSIPASPATDANVIGPPGSTATADAAFVF